MLSLVLVSVAFLPADRRLLTIIMMSSRIMNMTGIIMPNMIGVLSWSESKIQRVLDANFNFFAFILYYYIIFIFAA